MREGAVTNRTPRPIPHARPIHHTTVTNNIIAADGGPLDNLWLGPGLITNTTAVAAATGTAAAAAVAASDKTNIMRRTTFQGP